MGRVMVDLVLSNERDITLAEEGMLPPEKIRRVAIQGVVDTGAMRLVLPEGVVSQLGLPQVGEVTVRYANHVRETRPLVKSAHLKIQNRASTFTAITEANRSDALIGAIVLEELDFVVDCIGQRLIPRESDRILAEIE